MCEQYKMKQLLESGEKEIGFRKIIERFHQAQVAEFVIQRASEFVFNRAMLKLLCEIWWKRTSFDRMDHEASRVF